jgi:hypothetical protein
MAGLGAAPFDPDTLTGLDEGVVSLLLPFAKQPADRDVEGLGRRARLTCSKPLFDHLVGARKELRRDIKLDRSRSLEVDHKLELG